MFTLFETHAARLLMLLSCFGLMCAECWSLATGGFDYWHIPPIGLALWGFRAIGFPSGLGDRFGAREFVSRDELSDASSQRF
jgi:hypothetical protein